MNNKSHKSIQEGLKMVYESTAVTSVETAMQAIRNLERFIDKAVAAAGHEGLQDFAEAKGLELDGYEFKDIESIIYALSER